MGKFKEIDISKHDIRNIIMCLCILFCVIGMMQLIVMNRQVNNLKRENKVLTQEYMKLRNEYNKISTKE